MSDDNIPQLLTVAIVFAITAVAAWFAVSVRVASALAKAGRSKAALERANEKLGEMSRENAQLRREVGKLLAENEQLSGRALAYQASFESSWDETPAAKRRSAARAPAAASERILTDGALVFRKAPTEAETHETPTGEHIDTSV